ncbi:MAG: hypothetical protein IPF48_13815 [Sphingomonadales bacterium]|nr:hypothetical protein [Sphingomonadales bacterium]
MQPTTASPAITTPHVAASRAFYIKHFGARLVFDCGWFISLEFAPWTVAAIHGTTARAASL